MYLMFHLAKALIPPLNTLRYSLVDPYDVGSSMNFPLPRTPAWVRHRRRRVYSGATAPAVDGQQGNTLAPLQNSPDDGDDALGLSVEEALEVAGFEELQEREDRAGRVNAGVEAQDNSALTTVGEEQAAGSRELSPRDAAIAARDTDNGTASSTCLLYTSDAADD